MSWEDRKGRIGLFILAGDSWWEMGVCGAETGRYAGFMAKVEEDARRVIAALSADYEVVTPGIVHTADAAASLADEFNRRDVDAVVYLPIIWTNDEPLIAFIRGIRKVPVLLWSYDPYDGILDYYTMGDWLRASAPVSVQQSTNLFRRFGVAYEHVFGNENRPETKNAIRSFIRAALVKKSLTGTRIAVFPSPCRVVKATWFDELGLAAKLGVELVYVSVAEYLSLAADAPEEEIREAVDFLSRYPMVEVSGGQLKEAARQSVGMVRMIDRYGLSGIAIEDFNEEFYRLQGYRPHLYHPGFGERFCTIGLEADVLGVLATVIAGRLSGKIGMFTEFYTIDPHKNFVLMGHPGYGELSFASPGTVEVTPDIEIDDSRKRGVWVSYRAKEGPMTLLNLTADACGLKGGFFSGECRGGKRLMEGYSHMLIEPRTDAEKLFSKINDMALFQHWGAAYGDISAEIGYLSRSIGIPLADLDG